MKAKGFFFPSQARRTFGEERVSEARGCGCFKIGSHFVGRLSLGDLQSVLKCSNFPRFGRFVLLALLFWVGAHSDELSWGTSPYYALIGIML